MVFLYDPNGGYLATAIRIRDTVIPAVLGHYEFWFFFALHIAVLFIHRVGILPTNHEDGMSWKGITVISAFTTFFEVFYANSCFFRYTNRYKMTRELLGLLYDIAFEQGVYLRYSAGRQHYRVACRWLIASVVMFFSEVLKIQVTQITPEDAMHEVSPDLQEQGLLKASEQRHLEKLLPRQRCHILLFWSACVAKHGMIKSGTNLSMFKNVMAQYEKCRGLQQEIIDDLLLPMPFQYFHLLNVLVIINLFFWAWRMGMMGSLWSPVIYFFAAMILMGMAELSKQLSEPYGDDEVDFPVESWLGEFFENSSNLGGRLGGM
jgi:predicted membrane chloride channel (bestrophin family)